MSDPKKALSLESFVLDMTNTKRAEDALREGEKKYRSIFMNSPFGIAQYDKELNFVDFNDEFLNIFQISRDNLLLFDAKQINNEALMKAVKEVFSGIKGYYEGIYEAITSKTVLHILLRCFPIYNDENEIIGGIAIVEDISKDVWSRQLQDVTYQITLAASKSNSLIEFVDQIRSVLGKVLDVSNFFIAFYDKEKDFISLPYFKDEKDSFQEFPAGNTMTSYVIKNNKALLADTKKMRELIKQGLVEAFGTFSKIWLGVPLVFENVVIGAVVVQSYTDENAYGEKDLKLLTFISEQIAQLLKRLHLAERIGASEIKYRTLTEQLPLGVYRTDKDGKLLYANIKLAEMLKFDSIDELVGRQLSEFSVQPRSLKKYLDVYQKEGIASSLETHLKTKNGQVLWIKDTFTIIFDANGELSYIDGLLEDITEKKRAEDQINRLNAELEVKVIERTIRLENTMEELRFENEERKRTEEQLFIAKEETAAALKKEKELSEMKTRFMSMISHEYRTPLTIISSSTYILEKLYQGKHFKDFNNYLEKIRDSVKHMAKLLESVLVIGKSDAGMLKFNPTRIDLVELTKEICSEIKNIDNGKHNFEYISNVEECITENDEMIIRHILSNLLSNAAKYSELGKSIIFEFIGSNDRVVFKVSDSGIGISARDQERIFDAFHRGENIGNASGTGLGLSIVNRCVDLIGGEIYLNSRVGEGTTFIVSFAKK